MKETDLYTINLDNKEEFAKMYDRYAPVILGLIRKNISDGKQAEDALMRTFVHVWQHKTDYNSGKERFFCWILRCAREIAVTYRSNTVAGIPDLGAAAEKKLSNPNHALDMVYFNGYSIRTAAEGLNMEENQLKEVLIGAVRNLKTTITAS